MGRNVHTEVPTSIETERDGKKTAKANAARLLKISQFLSLVEFFPQNTPLDTPYNAEPPKCVVHRSLASLPGWDKDSVVQTRNY